MCRAQWISYGQGKPCSRELTAPGSYLNRSFHWGEEFPLRPHCSAPALHLCCSPEPAPGSAERSLPDERCSLKDRSGNQTLRKTNLTTSCPTLTCVRQPDDGGVVLGQMCNSWQDVLWVNVDVVSRHLLHQSQHFGQSPDGLSADTWHRVVAEMQQVRTDAVQQDVHTEPRGQVKDQLQRGQFGITGVERLQTGSDDGHQHHQALLLLGAQRSFSTDVLGRGQGGGRGTWRKDKDISLNRFLCDEAVE